MTSIVIQPIMKSMGVEKRELISTAVLNACEYLRLPSLSLGWRL